MLPILILIPLVLGGIYSGLATPSEAAALGLTGTLAITIILKQLTWKVFVESLGGAVRITCMALSILVAAGVLSSAMGFDPQNKEGRMKPTLPDISRPKRVSAP